MDSTLIRQTRFALLAPALARAARAPARAAAVRPAWQRVRCAVPVQQQSNWCWCAVALGVHQHYQASDTTTQCQAADRILQRDDACDTPANPQVNVPYYLERALAAFGHLRGEALPQPLTPPQIAQELGRDAPIGTRIGWPGGGGHFVVIDGLLDDGERTRVAIDDPLFGPTEMDLRSCLAAYHGSGRWTHSYLTCPEA